MPIPLPFPDCAQCLAFHHARRCRAIPQFRRIGATLELATTVELTCQRCLEPFELPIAERTELMFVEPDEAGTSIPEEVEPVELDDGRLLPARLIEDELIVAIPLVPKHARVEDCGSLARNLAT